MKDICVAPPPPAMKKQEEPPKWYLSGDFIYSTLNFILATAVLIIFINTYWLFFPDPRVVDEHCPGVIMWVAEGDTELRTMKRISPVSNYMYPNHSLMVSPKNAVRICEELGLQVATVHSTKSFQFLMGEIMAGKDLVKRREALTIMFRQKKDNGSTDHCGTVECQYTNGSLCFFNPKDCDDESPENLVTPICEFPEDVTCSQEVVAAEPGKDAMVGSLISLDMDLTRRRYYYGSMKPENWSVAMEICKAHNMDLLGFNLHDKLDCEIDISVKMYIKNLRNVSNEVKQDTWTSARFTGEGLNFKFDGSKQIWSGNAKEERALKWSITDISGDVTADGNMCVVLTDLNGALNRVSFRSGTCGSKKYFMCQSHVFAEIFDGKTFVS